MTDDQFIKRFIDEYGVEPGHFYSPLPDLKKAKENLHRWYFEDPCLGINFDLTEQKSFFNLISINKDELSALPSFQAVSDMGIGPGYGEIEARALYLTIRHLQPNNVIEVGSGVSTFYLSSALKNSAIENFNLCCIEPYPNEYFVEFAKKNHIRLEAREVQDIPLEFFDSLGDGDVLFIDSSHVCKVDSDVDFLYFRVLPRLKAGVFIHIHDITLPYPAIPLHHPLFDKHILFNENSIVRAFLMYNESFKVVMCQSYLHHCRPDILKDFDSLYNPQGHFPSSLWIKKTK